MKQYKRLRTRGGIDHTSHTRKSFQPLLFRERHSFLLETKHIARVKGKNAAPSLIHSQGRVKYFSRGGLGISHVRKKNLFNWIRSEHFLRKCEKYEIMSSLELIFCGNPCFYVLYGLCFVYKII